MSWQHWSHTVSALSLPVMGWTANGPAGSGWVLLTGPLLGAARRPDPLPTAGRTAGYCTASNASVMPSPKNALSCVVPVHRGVTGHAWSSACARAISTSWAGVASG